jgi:mannosyltransferase OCH1-like enzyme
VIKKIHQIWIGPKELPERFVMLCAEMKAMHPQYEYKLWDNESIHEEFKDDEIYLIQKDLNIPEAFKVNYLRMKILKKYGGWYIDVDSEIIQSLDTIETSKSMLIGYYVTNYTNGVIYSKPNNDLLDILLVPFIVTDEDTIKKYYNYTFQHLLEFSSLVNENINDIETVPSNWFYGIYRKDSIYIHSTFYSSHLDYKPCIERRLQ